MNCFVKTSTPGYWEGKWHLFKCGGMQAEEVKLPFYTPPPFQISYNLDREIRNGCVAAVQGIGKLLPTLFSLLMLFQTLSIQVPIPLRIHMAVPQGARHAGSAGFSTKIAAHQFAQKGVAS